MKEARISINAFHESCDAYASLLSEQGQNIKYFQTQLVHPSLTVLLNAYAHLISETNQEAANRLESADFERKKRQGKGMGKNSKEELRFDSQPLLN
jgi:hypothetical protein